MIAYERMNINYNFFPQKNNTYPFSHYVFNFLFIINKESFENHVNMTWNALRMAQLDIRKAKFKLLYN